MSELNIPESWAEAELFCISENIRGVTYSKSDVSESPQKNKTIILRANNISDGFINYESLVYVSDDKIKDIQKLRSGDILIAMSSGSIRVVGKAAQFKDDRDCSFGAFCGVLRLKSQLLIETRYFSWFFQTPNYRDYVSSVARGANINNLKTSHFEEIKVPLPPFLEQERIVQKIESCFSKIEVTEQNLNKVEILLAKYRESLLAKAFRGELIQQNHDDEPASVLLAKIREERAQNQKGKKKEQEFSPISDDEKPFDIPESWEWVRFGDVMDLSSGKGFKLNEYSKNGARLLQIANVSFGFTKWEVENFLPLNYLKKYPELDLKAGDVVIALNRPILTGNLKIAKICEDDLPAILYQRVGRFEFYSDSIIRDYFIEFCRSKYFIDYILSNLKGSDQPFINKGTFLNTLIPLPPINEQQKIYEKINKYLCLEREFLQKRIRLEAFLKSIKDSILNKAFEGGLVEQIESEGTGHELLQKILKQKDQEISVNKNIKKKASRKVSKQKTTKK